MTRSGIIKFQKVLGRAALLLFLISLGQKAAGQTPVEFFIGGANYYVNGKTDEAKNVVAQGLVKYPDDKKLNALKKKIEEEKPQDNKNKKNQDQNKDQNKDQKDNKKQNQDKQQQENQDQNKNQQQQQQQGISKEDAQRVLDAVANDEKNVQEKVKLAKASQGKVRTVKNW
jgi:hypothetical protein